MAVGLTLRLFSPTSYYLKVFQTNTLFDPPLEWVFETGEVNTLERDGGGCSVVAIKRSGTETLLAQNMDINRFYDGGQVRVVILPFLTF